MSTEPTRNNSVIFSEKSGRILNHWQILEAQSRSAAVRREETQEIEAAIEEFKKQGGKIQVL